MQSNQHLVIDLMVLIPCIDFSKTKNLIPTNNSDQPGAKADQTCLIGDIGQVAKHAPDIYIGSMLHTYSRARLIIAVLNLSVSFNL